MPALRRDPGRPFGDGASLDPAISRGGNLISDDINGVRDVVVSEVKAPPA